MEDSAIDQELNSTHDTEQAGENYDYPMLRMAIQNGFDRAGAQGGGSAGESIGSRIAGAGSVGKSTAAEPGNFPDTDPVQRMMDVDLLQGPQMQPPSVTTQQADSRRENESTKDKTALTHERDGLPEPAGVASGGSSIAPAHMETDSGAAETKTSTGGMQISPRVAGYFAGSGAGETSLPDQFSKPLHFGGDSVVSGTGGASLANGTASTPSARPGQKPLIASPGGTGGPGNVQASVVPTAGAQNADHVQAGKAAANGPAPGGASGAVTDTPAMTKGNASQKTATGAPPDAAARAAVKTGGSKTQQGQEHAGAASAPPAAKVAIEALPDQKVVDLAVRVMPTDRHGRSIEERVRKTMPSVIAEMRKRGMGDATALAYAIATIQAETGEMLPLVEQPSSQNTTKVPFDQYAKRNGNQNAEDGALFRGRGYIQLTGRSNYERMAQDTGLDLVRHPELAALPENGPVIFAQYLKWHEKELRQALAKGDMVAARAVVNGRNLKTTYLPNGLKNFLPAYQIAQRQAGVTAALEKNPNLSLGDVSKLWTRNDSAGNQSAYLQDMQKRLHIDLNKSYAQLTPRERALVEKYQSQHVSKMVEQEMPNLKAQALDDQKAWRIRQAERQARIAAAKARMAEAKARKAATNKGKGVSAVHRVHDRSAP